MASFHCLDRIHFLQPNVYIDLPTDLAAHDKQLCLDFVAFALNLGQSEHDSRDVLAALPITSKPSIAPLSLLSTLIRCCDRKWPVFDLHCCFARTWKHAPEHVKAGIPSPDTVFAESVLSLVKSTCGNLRDAFTITESPALKLDEGYSNISHRCLVDFVHSFRVPGLRSHRQAKIALAIPNGPLLALALLAATTYYISCPLSIASGKEQFRTDLTQFQADAVLVTRSDVERLGLDNDWTAQIGIQVLILDQQADLTFSMHPLTGSWPSPAYEHSQQLLPNGPDDTALLLFTSGTSGTKKTVPITVHSLMSGIAFVIQSWGLQSNDVCLNMMPLFHIGGIVRNLFAPIMSGGSVICCPAFDANLFWDAVEDHSPTWYYASPTMHQMILEISQHREDALQKSNIRLVCNAAGGLLPSLAARLRLTFRCTVLPSYGMTECMPISSPPLDYALDRPGTSGISVGPELGILDADDTLCSAGTTGDIVVRGAPLFAGYLTAEGATDRAPFNKSGWFRTGDLGYLDDSGYLYVTGRSKEVINRGGELISPFDVEEAVISSSQDPKSSIHNRISAVLAFAVPHAVLQEVVGLVVVTPPGKRRVCIKTVQEAVKHSLGQPKWPQVIVFMDDVPKNNNKALRIKLAQRMALPELSDDTLLADRHFEGTSPPLNSPLTSPIPVTHSISDLDEIARALFKVVSSDWDVYVYPSTTDGYPIGVLAPVPGAPANSLDTGNLFPNTLLADALDDINMPSAIHLLGEELPIDESGQVDIDQLEDVIRDSMDEVSGGDGFTATEGKVAKMFSQVLSCPLTALGRDSDFFDMGGDSLRAGRLLSELRKEANTRIPIDMLFTSGKIHSIAAFIDRQPVRQGVMISVRKTRSSADPSVSHTCNSTNPFLLVFQLLPILLIYPMKRALAWTIFMYVLAESQFWPTRYSLPGRIFNLIFSLAVGRLITFLITPLAGILTKWMLIGRYREGLYPMWGLYHTRWWLVQKVLSICGKGHFGMSNQGLVLYYRLLGAKIGSGVTINRGATLGEYDLLEIGDGANLDKCIFRAFSVEKNTSMYLGRVKLGCNASLGLNSIVAPGTVVPDEACVGPNSSSWEVKDADEENRHLSASKIPGANFMLDLIVSYPVLGLVNLVRSGPWIAGLIPIVILAPEESADKVASIIHWFAEPYRIGYHYLALILHSSAGVIAWFLAVVVVKKAMDKLLGKQKPNAVLRRTEAQKLRHTILWHIVPMPRFHDLLELFGSHYEITSMIYRALGAKVGQRVYWPGTGPSVQDFDMLDIGDDVVFGSRSHIVTSDGLGTDVVRIAKGAMISDRVVLLPGTAIGEKAVFGSGALSRRGKGYEANTVWVGSKSGEAVCLSDVSVRRKDCTISDIKAGLDKRLTTFAAFKVSSPIRSPGNGKGSNSSSRSASLARMAEAEKSSESTPFGRAFYQHQAPYRVFGLPIIVLYSTFITIFSSFYWNVPTTSSVQLLAFLLTYVPSLLDPGAAVRPVLVFGLFTLAISLIQTALGLLALSLTILAKWLLLGRRVAGNYDWDKSPYCQRWQLYLTVERLRRHCYGGQGILGLLTGTHWMVLYFRLLGAKIGRDCALFASGSPSCLFTEPDLLTLGDRVSVDDASLVGHINSRGVFDLNELSVGDGAVLRSGSRLLSGAKMGKGSVLMEHTLVMAGDEVEEGTVRQGWPGEEWEGMRMPTLSSGHVE